ncbi:MAG: serine/threonine-protein kinase [Polyangiaceae bacterium]
MSASARRLAKTPRTGSGPREQGELEETRRAVIRSYRLGVVIWPSFFLLDLYVVYVVAPGTPVWPFLAARVIVLAGAMMSFGAIATVRYPVALAEVAFYGTSSTGIAFMALYHGGLGSPYLHGISLVILVHAAVITSEWRRALFRGLLLTLPFPLLMALAAIWFPEVKAQWASPVSLKGFLENYLFVLATAVIGAFASHAVWSAQRQVYEARRLGRYRLKVRIGTGGMGDVWMAGDEIRKIDVAVKILSSAASQAAGAVARFEREAKIAANLRSRHTVRVFDYGASDDGVRYIAMELLSGSNLAQLVTAQGPMPIARAVHFARQACDSLDEAHRAGIVHRDIKPENLFVTSEAGEDDVLKLLDFGIAKIASDESNDATLTQAGWIGGTPAYMPPEVCAGGNAEPRSDLYSLGAVLYFLLTGVPPFEAETAVAMMTAHTREAPRPPSELRPDPACAALDSIVLRCLAKRPADRFPSAAMLSEALAGAGSTAT